MCLDGDLSKLVLEAMELSEVSEDVSSHASLRDLAERLTALRNWLSENAAVAAMAHCSADHEGDMTLRTYCVSCWCQLWQTPFPY